MGGYFSVVKQLKAVVEWPWKRGKDFQRMGVRIFSYTVSWRFSSYFFFTICLEAKEFTTYSLAEPNPIQLLLFK